METTRYVIAEVKENCRYFFSAEKFVNKHTPIIGVCIINGVNFSDYISFVDFYAFDKNFRKFYSVQQIPVSLEWFIQKQQITEQDFQNLKNSTVNDFINI